jgi:HAE1 family hydrophobic/amphiphilic exporter-1
MSRVKAALVGSREITSAAIAATIAVLAIFIPVVFMPGIVGKFLFQFGVTMSVAVALSLVEALTITPMRCSQFLAVGHNTWIGKKMDHLMDSFSDGYARSLKWVLDHRWITIGISLAVFSLVVPLAKMVKSEFVPSQDQSRFLVRILTPTGSSLEFTDGVFMKVEEKLLTNPAVDKYFCAVGGFGGNEPDTGNLFVTLKNPKERPVDSTLKRRPRQSDVMNWARKEFGQIPGVRRAIIQDLSQQGFSAQRGFPVEVSLLGRDWDELSSLSQKFQERMLASGVMT